MGSLELMMEYLVLFGLEKYAIYGLCYIGYAI